MKSRAELLPEFAVLTAWKHRLQPLQSENVSTFKDMFSFRTEGLRMRRTEVAITAPNRSMSWSTGSLNVFPLQ